MKSSQAYGAPSARLSDETWHSRTARQCKRRVKFARRTAERHDRTSRPTRQLAQRHVHTIELSNQIDRNAVEDYGTAGRTLRLRNRVQQQDGALAVGSADINAAMPRIAVRQHLSGLAPRVVRRRCEQPADAFRDDRAFNRGWSSGSRASKHVLEQGALRSFGEHAPTRRAARIAKPHAVGARVASVASALGLRACRRHASEQDGASALRGVRGHNAQPPWAVVFDRYGRRRCSSPCGPAEPR